MLKLKWKVSLNGNEIKHTPNRSVGVFTNSKTNNILLTFKRGGLTQEEFKDLKCYTHHKRLGASFFTLGISVKAAYFLMILLQNYFKDKNYEDL